MRDNSTITKVRDKRSCREQAVLLSTKRSARNMPHQSVRLDRKIAIYEGSFDKFAGLLENARVATASQPGDVKIIERSRERLQKE